MKNIIRKEKDIFPLRKGYHTSGNNEHHLSYNNKGLLHGRQIIYCNGKRDVVHNYNNGKKLFTISFYKNGVTASKTIYKNSMYRLHKTYFPDGELYLNQKSTDG